MKYAKVKPNNNKKVDDDGGDDYDRILGNYDSFLALGD